MMQNSAINFSVSVDDDITKLNPLIEELSSKYSVRFNTGLDLLTVRHYDKPTRKKLTANKEILMEQRTRHTYRVVLK
jgi:aspartate kinase